MAVERFVIENIPLQAAGRRGRPKGSITCDDSALVEQAIDGIKSGIFKNANHAAKQLWHMAPGNGGEEAKKTRLNKAIRTEIRRQETACHITA